MEAFLIDIIRLCSIVTKQHIILAAFRNTIVNEFFNKNIFNIVKNIDDIYYLLYHSK